MEETTPELKYQGLPRRYEETRPALEQAFAHNSILNIGEKILDKFHQTAEYEKGMAIKRCKKLVWKEAEEYKDKCIEEALQRAEAEAKFNRQELESAHKKHVKSEISRTEAIMEQKCIEEVFKQRKDGEKQMQEMAEVFKRKYELESMAEVEAARIEEQGIAGNIAQEAKQNYEQEKQQYHERLEEIKQQDIASLCRELERVRLEGVKNAHEEERTRASQEVEKINTAHKADIDDLLRAIDELNTEKKKLESDLHSMTKQRDYYIHKYNIVRNEFTAFIEQCRPDFSAGQADYLLSPTHNSKAV